ncbi:MAG: hypothetical protein LBG72_08360 [Spirochaetaceae bacterium]|nr:hypothetical protein [Spirochaetaceae bacterium]
MERQEWYCKGCGRSLWTSSLRQGQKPAKPDNSPTCVNGKEHKWVKKAPFSAPLLHWVCTRCGRHQTSRDIPPGEICSKTAKSVCGHLEGPPHHWVLASTFNWKPW